MADTETTDLTRLLHQFGLRALVLAGFATLGGLTLVAVALGLAACGLLAVPDERRPVRPAGASAGPEPRDWRAPGHGPRGGSPG
jgi:hypothetical protein